MAAFAVVDSPCELVKGEVSAVGVEVDVGVEMEDDVDVEMEDDVDVEMEDDVDVEMEDNVEFDMEVDDATTRGGAVA